MLKINQKILYLWGAIAVLALGVISAPVVAQDVYPTRPVTLIVPYPAGGGSDHVARLIAAKLEDELGQSVIVENRGGAGGNIGTRFVTRAKPDGYAIGLATPGPVSVGKSLYANLPYDPRQDLQPVILLNESPLVMVTYGQLPVKDSASFSNWTLQQKSGVNAGIGGTGSVNHLMTELYRIEAGVDLVNVPYKGGSEAVVDAIAGHVDMLFIPISAVLSTIKSGQLTPLFVTSMERSALLPDVPSVREVGLDNVVGSAWNGIVVPAGTPADIVDRLNRALNEVLQRQDVQDVFQSQGLETKGGSVDDFKEFIQADADKWERVITDAQIDTV